MGGPNAATQLLLAVGAVKVAVGPTLAASQGPVAPSLKELKENGNDALAVSTTVPTPALTVQTPPPLRGSATPVSYTHLTLPKIVGTAE